MHAVCGRPVTSRMKDYTMFHRTLSIVALATSMSISSLAWAAKDTAESTHDGKFVSLVGEKLEMTNAKGKEHSHMLAVGAKVTIDGNESKATDLKAGMKIRVTTHNNDKKVATHIEAIDQNESFANTHDGKFVSLKGHKLEMTDSKGKEHSHTMNKDATMTVDGKACKAEHLKAGMKIRVTTEKGDANVATHVEAIDKNPEFTLNL